MKIDRRRALWRILALFGLTATTAACQHSSVGRSGPPEGSGGGGGDGGGY